MTYKDFNAGDIFTADDADLLMRQGLIIVSGPSQRGAIVNPVEGMRVYRLDTHRTETHDGSGWVPDDTGWINLMAYATTGGAATLTELVGRRLNGVITISGTGSGSVPSVDSVDLAVALPAEWRPHRTMWGTGVSGGGAATPVLARTDGRLSLFNRTGSTQTGNVYVTLTFAR